MVKKELDLIVLDAETKKIFGIPEINPIHRLFPSNVFVEITQLCVTKDKRVKKRVIKTRIQKVRLFTKVERE